MKNIAVFAYAFPHRKTQDFLFELVAMGCKNVTVIGAPWRPLAHQAGADVLDIRIRKAPPHTTADLCKNLDLHYLEADHNDRNRIEALQRAQGLQLAVIAGARILPKAVIDIFPEGVINFHPGKIPETSGLDAFFYAIKQDVSMGVSAHFIDAKVDAGHLILFEELPVSLGDSPETVQENLYHLQIMTLRKIIPGIMRDEEIASKPIFRPSKNQPMPASEKLDCLQRFPQWLAGQLALQNPKTRHRTH